MKLKKRIVRVLSLMLCAVLLAASLTACGDVDERGAYVNVYLGAEVRSWDPAIGFTDAAAEKYFSLVYEGLMTYGRSRSEGGQCKDQFRWGNGDGDQS